MEFGSSVTGRDVSRETISKLERYAELILAENGAQNLISKASEAEIWQRHLIDSAQLLRFAPAGVSWTDLGTGPGLPGIVLAILDDGSKRLVEPRNRRVEFLRHVIVELGLANVQITAGKAQIATGYSEIITARALGPPGAVFTMSSQLRHAGTTYVLPRGQSAKSELAELQNTWQGEFTLHRSLTSDEASILVARHVRRKGSR